MAGWCEKWGTSPHFGRQVRRQVGETSGPHARRGRDGADRLEVAATGAFLGGGGQGALGWGRWRAYLFFCWVLFLFLIKCFFFLGFCFYFQSYKCFCK